MIIQRARPRRQAEAKLKLDNLLNSILRPSFRRLPMPSAGGWRWEPLRRRLLQLEGI